MEDVFLSATVPGGRTLCVSPLSAKAYRESVKSGLGGDFGYFIYEIDSFNPRAGFEVIAKAASYDAAIRLFDLLVRGAAEPVAA